MDVIREWLVSYREVHGFSQTEVALKVGLTRQMISAVENGSQPSVGTAKKLGRLFNFDWTRFFNDDK